MYSIEFSETAYRQLRRLEHPVQLRIVSVLERIRLRPYSHLRRIVGSPYFRLRAGPYRIILDIQHGQLIIFVIAVGHRRDVYK